MTVYHPTLVGDFCGINRCGLNGIVTILLLIPSATAITVRYESSKGGAVSRIFVSIVCYLLTQSCFGQFASSPASRDGIWQDKDHNASYYSVHEKAGVLVLISLAGVAAEPDPLRSSYRGSTKPEGVAGIADVFLLKRIAPVNGNLNVSVSINFLSATEAMLSVICDVCSSVPINLRKVF